jgi:hypothetical protein
VAPLKLECTAPVRDFQYPLASIPESWLHCDSQAPRSEAPSVEARRGTPIFAITRSNRS